MFYDEVDDVLAAAEALAGMPQVDQQRLYLAGYSAGGTLTMLATMASGRFRAAAALDGSPDRRTFARGFSKEVPFERDNPEEYRMRSPIDFPGSFKCPIRLYCSQEANGYIEETQRLTCWAQAKGLDVEMVTVRGDHGTFRLPASRLAIEFFRQR
jgi:dipeptidyl aminopeptidase/acylaminoacyl peptidase